MGWRRLSLLVIAVWLTAIGVSWGGITNEANLDAVLPELGAPLMYAGAALLVVLAARPNATVAYMLGGPLAIGGLIARPLIVWLNYAAGFTKSGWAVVTAVLIYGMLAAIGVWLQVWKVGPWVGRHKRGALAPGD